MIITRTPFRISFFGGGTDYPEWYTKHGGSVLSTTIDKYCYITCRKMPEFFDHRYRLMYAKVENTNTVEEIQHPVVRETLKYMKIPYGLEIHHDADLPARSGCGASSAFTVGLLNALYNLEGLATDKMNMSSVATYIERDLVGDTVGSQDQVAVAYGGLNQIEFFEDNAVDEFKVTPILLSDEAQHDFQSHLMLFHTRIYRSASEIASTLEFKEGVLHQMQRLPYVAIEMLKQRNWKGFGELLHHSWLLKKSMSDRISTKETDEIYQEAMQAGAWGGKVIGAGAGGFMLFIVPPDKQACVQERLNKLVHVPFKLESRGTGVLFNNE